MLVRAMIAVVASLGLGCAGGASNTPTTPFRASDAELFDNAVDLVATPAVIEGAWSGAFERRVTRADVVAAVRTQSLSEELVRRRGAYRIEMEVSEWLKGSSSRELVLRVSDEEAGYRSVQVNEDRLLHDSFVAFVKWEKRRGGEPEAHWHLSPDSPGVREKVDHVLQRRPHGPQTEDQAVAP
jgi:hypothetical protein